MKIIFLGDALAEHLRRWSKFFSGLGHEVHVITWNTRILDDFAPVTVHKLEKTRADAGVLSRCINLLQLRRDVRRLIAQIQPDLIHAHSAGAYAWMGMFTGFHPYVVSPWGTDILVDVQASVIDRFFTIRALKYADLIHCDGENIKSAMAGFGVDPAKIVILAFGVDVDRFSAVRPQAEIIEKYGLSRAKVIVSTRTLNPIHNIETVIRAVPAVLQAIPDAKFLIVGGGSDDLMLRSLAESLGVKQAVRFTGRVEENEMAGCLKAADVYVSTSLSESGLAASTAEAMACGLPVINTETGDIRLWIKDAEGGYIIPVKSPEILADKIIYLLRHETDRKQYGVRNRAVIMERNNVFIEMKKMERIYCDLADSHGMK